MADPQTGPYSFPFIEIVNSDAYQESSKTLSAASNFISGIKIISAVEAFGQFDWLNGVPVLNISGNLRGMVVSARWRTIFKIPTFRGFQFLGTLSLVAGFVANLVQESDTIEAILASSSSATLKRMELTIVADRALQRTVLGIFPALSSLAFDGLASYCRTNAGMTASPQFCSDASVGRQMYWNQRVQTEFNTWTDPVNQAAAIHAIGVSIGL